MKRAPLRLVLVLALWLSVVTFLAPNARAQAAAVATGVLAANTANAATVATQNEAVQGFPGSEPEDWLDPRTRSTSVLARACGVVAEVSLTVTASTAFVNVVVSNESGEVLGFQPAATLVQLGSGTKRRVESTIPGDLMIQPGWRRWLSMPLPSKSDLRGLTSLGVELTLKSPSFGPCRLQTRLVRPSGPERAETYQPFFNAIIGFGAGPRLLTTGKLHELTPKVGVAVVFDLAFFWSLHHGVALDIALETPGRGAVSKVAPDNDFGGKGSVEAAGFFLGYLYRFQPVGRLSIAYSPELGVIPFQLTNGDTKDRVEATRAVFCPKHRLRASIPVAPVLDGAFTLGLSLSHTYVPYGRLGEAELRGNLISAALLLGLEG